MRFWLSLIGGTIIISFGLTWLQMHQGKEILSRAPIATASAPRQTAEITFDLAPNQKSASNVVETTMQDTVVGKSYDLEVKFRNTSKEPLRLEYYSESCGCLEILANGKPFGKGAAPLVVPAGEGGKLILRWKPEAKHLAAQSEAGGYRFYAEFKSNDPRFNAPIRIEAVSRILPKPQGS